MDPKRHAGEEIVRRLRAAGHVALFAGGCVRDHLLGRTPQDWDIATSARPETVRDLFPKTVPVGMKFGVVLVVHGGIPFEVTTFRAEEGYSDGRHPDRVRFTDRPEEDALRRDFTVNGLYLDPETGEILDWVGGKRDLEAGRIRAIGDPEARFAEDYLRMLRAVRFLTALDFEATPDTEATLKRSAKRIASISAERIREEVLKILALPRRRRGVERMLDYGLLEVILPEVASMRGVAQPPAFHPEGDVLEHTLVMLDLATNPSETLAFGILLHDVGKPVTASVTDRIRFHRHARESAKRTASICNRFRFSKAQTMRIVALVKEHMKFMEVKRMRPSTLKRFLRQDGFDEHLELHRLDCVASHGKLDHWEFARERIEAFGKEGLRPAPLINGRDLMNLHIPRGPLYGRILSASEEGQLAGTLSTREEALDLARKMWDEEQEKA